MEAREQRESQMPICTFVRTLIEIRQYFYDGFCSHTTRSYFIFFEGICGHKLSRQPAQLIYHPWYESETCKYWDETLPD